MSGKDLGRFNIEMVLYIRVSLKILSLTVKVDSLIALEMSIKESGRTARLMEMEFTSQGQKELHMTVIGFKMNNTVRVSNISNLAKFATRANM